MGITEELKSLEEMKSKGSGKTMPARHADTGVGSENSEPLIPEILSRSALEGETSSKFR